MDLVALRTEQLSYSMGNFTRRNPQNDFYVNQEHRNALEEFMGDLRLVVDRNNFLGKEFEEIKSHVDFVSNMSHFFDHVEDIEKVVG